MEFLPDLMTMLDGAPVSQPDQWEKRRRELIDILRKNIFGYEPATLSPGRGEILEVDQKCCAGHAEMETVKITVDTEKGPFSFPMLYFRNTMQEKSPLFLLVNFRPEAYDRYFPIEEIVDNGFSLAMIYYKDVTSDDGDWENGLAPCFTRPTDGTGFGKITLWAWAASRALDYLLTRPEVDADHVAVIGHSRLGKTALWCGAQDERIRYVISNDSGCAGAALERAHNPGGETTRDITRNFPYWFCENYLQYIDHPEKMPFDQHFLVAASAPRFVAVGSAHLDLWADPINEQKCCMAASPAWKLFGKQGYVGPETPASVGDHFHDGEISYHLRHGTHFLSRRDWAEYMTFIKKHW